LARIALAAAGAVIGALLALPTGGVSVALGLQIGLAVGGIAGSILFPGKVPPGPRLNDLTVMCATNGAPIPFGWGLNRVSGNLIWSSGLVEHVTKKSVKGGPKQTTYSYTASFAVAFGEGQAALGRIWGDSKILYAPGGNSGAITAISAAGSGLFQTVTVTCALNPAIGSQVTITGVPVTRYNGKFKVASSSATQFTYLGLNFGLAPSSGGTATGEAPRYPAPVIYTGTELQNADPTIQAAVGAANCPAYRGLCYAVFTNLQLNDFGNRIPNIRAEITYQAVHQSAGFGTFDQSVQNSAGAGSGGTASTNPALTPANAGTLALFAISAPGVIVDSTWFDFGTVIGMPALLFQIKSYSGFNPISVSESISLNQRWASNLHLFASDGSSLTAPVTSIQITGNVITAQCASTFIVGTRVKFSGLTNAVFLNAQTVIILTNTGTSFTAAFVHANYGPTSDTGTGTNSPFLQMTSANISGHGASFAIVLGSAVKPGSTILAVHVTSDVNAAVTMSTVTDNQGGSYTVKNSISSGGSPANRPSSNVAYGQGAAGGSTTVTVNFSSNLSAPGANVYIIELPGGSQILATPTLPDIVTDVSKRSGLQATDIDTSLLAPVTPPGGYVVGRVTGAADILKPLALAYFFDGVESNGVIKYVPRGGATASLTVPETDLGLWKDNHELVEQMGMAQDLPREISVLFNDPALDYQQNTQKKRRHTKIVHTKQQMLIELPFTVTPGTARQISEKALFLAYLERRPFEMNLWKALYMLYDPTDVITFVYEGLTIKMRIVKIGIGVDYQVAVTGVFEDQAVYTSVIAGTSGSGVIPATGRTLPDTTLFLFDSPLLRDIDSNDGGSGLYFAMSAIDIATWPGASLQKSSDDINFAQENTSSVGCSYGICGNTLGVPPISPWVWDMVNTLTIFMTQGTLAGATDLAVLNGANALMIGSEVIQFANAVQNGDGSYTVSRLLRGRRGTDIYCNTHGAAELVVDLNAGGVIRQPEAMSEVQNLRYYRPVTFGADISTITSQLFTLQANDLRPYAVTSVESTRDDSFNLAVTWIRRTRIGGDWLNGIGIVPLSEVTESYDVDIMNGNTVVRTLSGLTSPDMSYTAADQTTDFGSPQPAITMNIYQNSATIGRGFVKTVTV
jgi:hypothetical protein